MFVFLLFLARLPLPDVFEQEEGVVKVFLELRRGCLYFLF
jgi:hypothetical protein